MELSFSQHSASQSPPWLLLGICGAGMQSFAQHLHAIGIPVIGADRDHDALQQLTRTSNLPINLLDWSAVQRGLTPPVSTVVHSVAVPSDGPELTTLRRRGLSILSLPQAIALQFARIPQLCIAGTHGKSTTTGMLWWILHHSGRSTARYIGAEFQPSDAPRAHEIPGAQSANPGFTSAVLEACEYRDSFLTLQPSLCVLTGIESDHFDWFTTPTAAAASFENFLARVRSGGAFIHSADCAVSRQLAARYSTGPTISWSTGAQVADWQLDVHPTRPGSLTASGQLLPVHRGSPIDLRLRIPGDHNLRNATAAVLAATQQGIDPQDAARLLTSFPGIRRRFEHRGTWRGADLIDDYAHHPTAVSVTLQTVRQVYPGRRVLAVFEPHQISRTQRLLSDFAAALAIADDVIVVPVLAARESASAADRTELSRELVRQICNAGGRAKLVGDLDHVPGKLDDAVHSGDLLITMGAGRTNLIHDEIHRTIQRDSAA
jgi:UDP-N-acetylmuramate--alanine ligase